MEYPIGIEMSPDYLSYEVSKAAYKLVKEMMLVEPGENVVVTGDTSTDKRVLDAIMNAAYIVCLLYTSKKSCWIFSLMRQNFPRS